MADNTRVVIRFISKNVENKRTNKFGTSDQPNQYLLPNTSLQFHYCYCFTQRQASEITVKERQDKGRE